jgi:hypothetical protein
MINAWRHGAFGRGLKIKWSICMKKILRGGRFGGEGMIQGARWKRIREITGWKSARERDSAKL